MKSQTLPSQSSSSSFPFAVTRIAVAQICRSVGFKSAQNSALSTITEVATRYLQAVAAAAVSAANSAGRTESNIADIVAALEQLQSVTGFSGGSNVNLRFHNSGPLIDIMKFVKYSDEIPFAKPLPARCSEERQRFVGSGDEKNGKNHIPRWLPAIPEIAGILEAKEEFGFRERLVLDDEKMGLEKAKGGEVVKRGMELPLKRGKVRFKIGVGRGGMGFGGGLRSGICNGGKRILVQMWSGNDQNENKEKSMKYKRKKIKPKKLKLSKRASS